MSAGTLLASNPLVLASLQRVQVVNYFYSVLLYDHVLTFGEEVSLVWPARWKFGKVLFVLARYPPYIDMSVVLWHQLARSPSVELCHDSFRIAGWANIIGISITEVILMMRTWALWSKDIRVVIALLVLGAGCLGGSSYVTNVFLESMTFIHIDKISPQLTGCFVSGGSKLIYVAFILLMVFETGAYLTRNVPLEEH
ncbi:hypothetical protein EUX98_g4883 [Antrodiella citrinella]|uniref:DUF6533 domain-containing protein n=1 Tax=Antrodiella citrinella TaxID=2447956 RepID=A0A4S4MVP3_9APHY|nr:hypothetical protein EUX98_g4883 [Antrodiella citrinella]